MQFSVKNPPREYEVGYDQKSVIKDCAIVQLEPNEQITFTTERGGEYDVTRKNWGFYATPSLNGRLSDFQLQAVLVKNKMNRFFVLLVEKGREVIFQEYINSESLIIICWMNNNENLQILERSITEQKHEIL